MYNLLYYELRKLLGRPFVLVGMLILILVNVSCFCTQSLPSIVAREKEDSAYASGFQAVEIEQRLAQKYGETLTDDVVQQMLHDFQPSAEFMEKTSGVHTAYIYNNSLQQAVQYHFANADGSWNGLSVEQVFGYDSLPLGYSAGWIATCTYMLQILLLLCLFLILVIAPVFCGEYGTVEALLLSAKYGRTKLIQAKILAALIFSIGLICLFFLINFALAFYCFGGQGLDACVLFSFENAFSNIASPLSCGQLLRAMFFLSLSGAISVAAITLALSAASKNTYIALIAALFVFLLPLLLNLPSHHPFYKALMLCPVYQVMSNHILSADSISILGKQTLFAWLCLPFDIIISTVAIVLAHARFAKHEVT